MEININIGPFGDPVVMLLLELNQELDGDYAALVEEWVWLSHWESHVSLAKAMAPSKTGFAEKLSWLEKRRYEALSTLRKSLAPLEGVCVNLSKVPPASREVLTDFLDMFCPDKSVHILWQ